MMTRDEALAALADGIPSAEFEALVDAGVLTRGDAVRDEDTGDYYDPASSLTFDPYTDRWYSETSDWESVVVSGGQTELWHPERANDHAFQCEQCSLRFSVDRYYTVDVEDPDGNFLSVCWQEYRSSLRAYDDHYRWYDEEYEDEGDDDGANDRSPDRYHDAFRPWEAYDFVTPAEAYGIELELDAKHGNRSGVAAVARSHGMIAEDDGSLGINGVEVIASPMTYEDNLSVWGAALDALSDVARGWDAGDGYGQHISMNAAAMSKAHIAKFVYFLNAPENKPLCVKVAGRESERWAAYGARKLHDEHKLSDKYRAASVRSDGSRIEVRIFRSTTNPVRFFRNLDFVRSVRAFALQASFRGLSIGHYMQWLVKQPKLKKLKEWLAEFAGEKPRQVDSDGELWAKGPKTIRPRLLGLLWSGWEARSGNYIVLDSPLLSSESRGEPREVYIPAGVVVAVRGYTFNTVKFWWALPIKGFILIGDRDEDLIRHIVAHSRVFHNDRAATIYARTLSVAAPEAAPEPTPVSSSFDSLDWGNLSDINVAPAPSFPCPWFPVDYGQYVVITEDQSVWGATFLRGEIYRVEEYPQGSGCLNMRLIAPNPDRPRDCDDVCCLRRQDGCWRLPTSDYTGDLDRQQMQRLAQLSFIYSNRAQAACLQVALREQDAA